MFSFCLSSFICSPWAGCITEGSLGAGPNKGRVEKAVGEQRSIQQNLYSLSCGISPACPPVREGSMGQEIKETVGCARQ